MKLRTISTNRWNSRPLWTYPAPSGTDGPGRRIGPENDDFDLVSHALEDRAASRRAARLFAPSRSRQDPTGGATTRRPLLGRRKRILVEVCPWKNRANLLWRNVIRGNNVLRAPIAHADDVSGALVCLTFPGERISLHTSSDAPTIVLEPLTHGCVDVVRDRLTNLVSGRKQLEVADVLLQCSTRRAQTVCA